ncbi:type II CRISPR RNA-guided endonuclease Cas9 [uncultured Ruminococcus sp.]|uniref:type II CRISPR RNA-guided endonuclease Cas9 n=1 Tax=uncultured Ruminococcus sp. TaxID=165186 RepID=UPI0025D4FEE6|nr:type II CRISPR RNA-guided endonuclease Cas9 [uncultured Ruminococcus sp.]
MKYSIGLDIGITSIGYAVMLLDGNDQPCRIMRMGSRIFDAAENPKDGSSLAAPRRENRGMRRRLRRKRFRKERIKSLIEQSGIMSVKEINSMYQTAAELPDIYEIRCRSLDSELCKEEFVRLLVHLSQRRGFKSNRKIDSQDKKSEAGALLSAVEENKRLLESKGYRTIGEMLYKDEKFSEFKRNKSDNYSNTFARQAYCDEIKLIFSRQREFGNVLASEKLENDFLEIYLSQRSFDDGPGGESIYGGNQIEKMLGKCTFEKGELRAVKASFSFEYFNLLSKVNAIKIVSASGKRALTDNERNKIISLAFSKNCITYKSLRKELGLSDSEHFNISYGEKSVEDTEKKMKFTYLNAYHTFKKAYGESFTKWNTDKKNELAYALTVYKNDSKITAHLADKGFDDAEISIALTLPSFSKTGNLSVKALEKIIPFLEQGQLYNEACLSAGYNFKADEQCKEKFLPANPETAVELKDLTNPVVRRAVSQTIKVINAIIREFDDSPVFVNLELARELSKNFKDRKDIEKSQKDNQAANERIMERLRNEFHRPKPTGQDLIKLKLWEEQDGICPYSLKPISIDRLFEIGYTDIDHIVPYSISFDDTYNNKVLVLSSENRQKGNRLPMQYLSEDKKDSFYLWVDNSNLRSRKKKNLLKETITDDDLSGFKKRNLQDTQYISRFLLNYLKKYLQLAPNTKDRKNTIVAVNGATTAYVRKRWGISKIRENGDVHHAVDAVVIACITQAMIKRISEYSKYHENEYINNNGEYFDIDKRTGEMINRFPTPYPYLRDEIDILCSNDPSRYLLESPLPNYSVGEDVKPIFVSRMPKRKITGAAHKDTIRKPYEIDGKNYAVSKVALTSLKLKDGEIENYFNPSSDILLYNALLKRLKQFNGDAKAAFAEEFNKPKSDGSKGPRVKKVKIIEKSTLTVPVHNGTAIADNDSMVRTDVFYVEGEGYYLVPIYVADTVRKMLPNKAITRDRSYCDWKVMDEKDFLFSLYPNDLIHIVSKKDMKFSLVNKDATIAKNYISKDIFVYFKGTDISTASITAINHDNTYKLRGLGVKSLLSMEKCQVDVLGNVTKSGREKRMGFR